MVVAAGYVSELFSNTVLASLNSLTFCSSSTASWVSLTLKASTILVTIGDSANLPPLDEAMILSDQVDRFAGKNRT